MANYPLVKITEGLTEVLVPDVEAFKTPATNFPPSEAPVFYNHKMEINRDIALAVLRSYQAFERKNRTIRYCEPMAGSGIRSVRVANELKAIKVVINDRNRYAVELIKKNVRRLKLRRKTTVHGADANELLVRNAAASSLFDVIDLDPFGSPSEFLGAVAQAIARDGLVAVTSTDMATMCGVYPQACVRKYLAMPIRSWLSHEIAVRMLVGFTAQTLARHGKGIEPILAHSTAHFIRAYVISRKGITKAKNSLKKLGYLAHCRNCSAFENKTGLVNSLTKTCPVCGGIRAIAGPIWLGVLHDKKYVDSVLLDLETSPDRYGSKKRMTKLLSQIKEECLVDAVTGGTVGFYDIHSLTDKLNLPSPKLLSVIASLQKKQFAAQRTHFRTNSVKTNADIVAVNETIKSLLKDRNKEDN